MKIMHWLNEPAEWQEGNDTIIVQTEPKTDFWCKTINGEVHDNGHFYYQSIHLIVKIDDFKCVKRVRLVTRLNRSVRFSD